MTRTAREVRKDLDAIEPWPAEEPTAERLAKYFAVRAQERGVKQLIPGHDPDVREITVMTGEYAAAHALWQLAKTQGGLVEFTPDEVAAQIWAAIDGGEGIGEWLWEILGTDMCQRVADLAEELVAAVKAEPPKPDPQRDRMLALAAGWEAESDRLRAEFARDVHPALASGHKEANALQARAAELRAAVA